MGHGIEEPVDCGARHHATLRQRTEAHCPGALCKVFQACGVGDVIPCHIFFDFILGYACLVDFHLYRPRWIWHGFNKLLQTFRIEIFNDFSTEFVIADCAYNTAR